MKYLLDTHAWLWMLDAPEKLTPKVRKTLDSEENLPTLLLSTISLIEITTLVKKKRLNFIMDPGQWFRTAFATSPITLVPVTEDIAWLTIHLHDFDHYDPSDRIIVATAQAEEAILITADRTLRQYKNVQTLW